MAVFIKAHATPSSIENVVKRPAEWDNGAAGWGVSSLNAIPAGYGFVEMIADQVHTLSIYGPNDAGTESDPRFQIMVDATETQFIAIPIDGTRITVA